MQRLRYLFTVVIVIAITAHRGGHAADELTTVNGVMRIEQIVEHSRDPLPDTICLQIDDAIADLECSIEVLKKHRVSTRDDKNKRTRRINELRDRIRELQDLHREYNRRAAKGAVEFRGWDGMAGREVVIWGHGQRNERLARRLRHGQYIDYIAEKQKANDRYNDPNSFYRWLELNDADLLRQPPDEWVAPPMSYTYTWARRLVTTIAKVRFELTRDTRPSGRPVTHLVAYQDIPEHSDGPIMELRVRVYALDAHGQRAALVSPNEGFELRRGTWRKSDERKPLQCRFSPRKTSSHGYDFEIIEALATP